MELMKIYFLSIFDYRTEKVVYSDMFQFKSLSKAIDYLETIMDEYVSDGSRYYARVATSSKVLYQIDF